MAGAVHDFAVERERVRGDDHAMALPEHIARELEATAAVLPANLRHVSRGLIREFHAEAEAYTTTWDALAERFASKAVASRPLRVGAELDRMLLETQLADNDAAAAGFRGLMAAMKRKGVAPAPALDEQGAAWNALDACAWCDAMPARRDFAEHFHTFRVWAQTSQALNSADRISAPLN